MNYPEQLRYTKDHEWILMDGNEATVGITHFAQEQLGDIVYVDINTVGKSLSANEVFGTVEAVKAVSDLFLPLAGKILQVNPLLEKQPELVNKDPYGDGWMIKLKVDDIASINELLDAVAYESLVNG